jgi:hypothetical protein
MNQVCLAYNSDSPRQFVARPIGFSQMRQIQ